MVYCVIPLVTHIFHVSSLCKFNNIFLVFFSENIKLEDVFSTLGCCLAKTSYCGWNKRVSSSVLGVFGYSHCYSYFVMCCLLEDSNIINFFFFENIKLEAVLMCEHSCLLFFQNFLFWLRQRISWTVFGVFG